jgi:hypothetical protein
VFIDPLLIAVYVESIRDSLGSRNFTSKETAEFGDYSPENLLQLTSSPHNTTDE